MVDDYVEETSRMLKQECAINYYNKDNLPKLRALEQENPYKLGTLKHQLLSRVSLVSKDPV